MDVLKSTEEGENRKHKTNPQLELMTLFNQILPVTEGAVQSHLYEL